MEPRLTEQHDHVGRWVVFRDFGFSYAEISSVSKTRYGLTNAFSRRYVMKKDAIFVGDFEAAKAVRLQLKTAQDEHLANAKDERERYAAHARKIVEQWAAQNHLHSREAAR